MEMAERQPDNSVNDMAPNTASNNTKKRRKHDTSPNIKFDDGLQVQPPKGLSRFDDNYFKNLPNTGVDMSEDDWLADIDEVAERENIKEPNSPILLAYEEEATSLRLICKSARNGNADLAVMMAKQMELLDEEEEIDLSAKIYMFNDMWGDALKCINKYNSDVLPSWRLFDLAADVLYRMNKTAELDELCKIWEKHAVNRINLHVSRARVLCRKGLLDDGLNITEAILTLEPTEPMAHLLKGNILATRGLHDDAIKSFEEGLKHDSDPLLSLGLVKSLYAVGKKRQAQKMRDGMILDGVSAKALASIL